MIPPTGEIALLAVAVFLIGTPHGALDARLAREWLRPVLGSRWAVPFVAGYLVLTGLTLALWLAAPGAALALFLLLAAVHFGHHDSPSGRWRSVLVRGTLLPVVAAAAHPEAIRSIFTLLAGDAGHALAGVLGGPLLFLWLPAAALILLFEARKEELLLLPLLIALVPPLMAFAAYFALIHTPRALAASRRPGERWSDVLAAALPWTIAAVALALPLWLWMTPELGTGPALVRTIFWWLSALTVPHMVLHLLTDLEDCAAESRISASATRRSEAV